MRYIRFCKIRNAKLEGNFPDEEIVKYKKGNVYKNLIMFTKTKRLRNFE